MWKVVSVFNDRDGFSTHVIPVDDLRSHEECSKCHCNPNVNDGLKMIVHNSFDVRELYETGKRKPS